MRSILSGAFKGLSMEESQQKDKTAQLPFQNLFLITGLVNGMNKFWMYLGTIFFTIAGYVSFQLIILYPLMNRLFSRGYSRTDIEEKPGLLFDAGALGLDVNLILALELGMFVFAFFAFLAGLKLFHNKAFQTVITGYEKFRFKRFTFSFLIWSLLLILVFVSNYILEPAAFTIKTNYPGLLVSVLVMVVMMPVQTGLEEVLFRGYLVQGLAIWLKNGWMPLLLSSGLFALAHMSNPEVDKYGWGIMFPYYLCFALFMGTISLLDEGLELAFGIHFANNLVSSILVSSPNSVIKTHSFFEANSENPLAEMAGWVIMALLSFLIFARIYKWKNYNLIIR